MTAGLSPETEIQFLRSIIRELKAENHKLKLQLGQIFDIQIERDDDYTGEVLKASGAV